MSRHASFVIKSTPALRSTFENFRRDSDDSAPHPTAVPRRKFTASRARATGGKRLLPYTLTIMTSCSYVDASNCGCTISSSGTRFS